MENENNNNTINSYNTFRIKSINPNPIRQNKNNIQH